MISDWPTEVTKTQNQLLTKDRQYRELLSLCSSHVTEEQKEVDNLVKVSPKHDIVILLLNITMIKYC